MRMLLTLSNCLLFGIGGLAERLVEEPDRIDGPDEGQQKESGCTNQFNTLGEIMLRKYAGSPMFLTDKVTFANVQFALICGPRDVHDVNTIF